MFNGDKANYIKSSRTQLDVMQELKKFDNLKKMMKVCEKLLCVAINTINNSFISDKWMKFKRKTN